MKRSILKGVSKEVCFLCGWTATENHHIFEGSNRKKSDKDGLTVFLCHSCHNEPPYGVHFNRALDIHLKQIGQKAWMRHYNKTVEDFIREYGKNYL